ncbi:MAG: 6-carboxytetrahydropterin synthase [Sediminibacterium sp.]|jgi:6-pyruvoyltetrahydropterin/6-carboxytetrahydropterin synthase
MIHLTKIFHFEMAHAIHGYNGACKNIHGHSYELQVTLSASENTDVYIPSPGFVIDFKEIKKIVNNVLIEHLDHKLVLSSNYLNEHPYLRVQENLVQWQMEPSAENILLYTVSILRDSLTSNIKLVYLKLHETKDSYAEWFE